MDYYDPDYEPYQPPQTINIEYDHWRHVFPFLFHVGAGLAWGVLREYAELKVEEKQTKQEKNAHWWRGTRNLANQKFRKHGTYFEHETTVTDFKRKLDEN